MERGEGSRKWQWQKRGGERAAAKGNMRVAKRSADCMRRSGAEGATECACGFLKPCSYTCLNRSRLAPCTPSQSAMRFAS